MKIHRGRLWRPLLRCVATAAIVGALAVPSVSQAARFLHFQARATDGGAELVAAGQTVLRLRAGMRINGGAAALAAELNDLAFAGLTPAALTIRSAPPNVQILAGTKVIATIDPLTSQAVGSSPPGLAANWLANLKQVFSAPYVVLEPRTRLQVPLGETRPIRWGGTAAADITFVSSAPDVASVELHPNGQSLLVKGVGVGAATVTATLEGETVPVPVEVKAWAARVPDLVAADVTSPPLPADDLRRTLRNALLSAVSPGPGARLELGEPVCRDGRYVLALHAAGPGCFDVDREVAIKLNSVKVPVPTTRQLLVSNLPEKITEGCALLREHVRGTAPVRLLWHHVNRAGRPLRFVVRLANLGDQDARVHVTDAACGPHHDEIFVGHQAILRFLALSEQGEGYVLNVPAGRMIELYDTRLPAEQIVSGLARLTPLVSEDLLLEVLAEDAWPTDAYFAPVPQRLRDDPPLTPYLFEAEKEVELAYQAGGPWTFYHVGKDGSTNLQGQKLYGDYGVGYTIGMTCTNPTAAAARCVLTLRAGGGVARATYYLQGRLTETGLLRSGQEETISRFDLAPGQQQVMRMYIVPESGSNYPITLTLRNL